MDFYAHSFLAVVYRSLASLGLVALVAGGCDATFEGWGAPPEEVAAVFGVLDVRAARQTVRLEAVRTDPDRPLVPQPLEAELVDEGTGTRIPATMRLVTLDDGSQARLADFFTRIVPGRAYRLEVRDAQGRAGAARTVVPIDHAMRVQAPRRDSLKLTQGVVVEGLSRAPAGVLLRYHLVVTLGPDRNFGDTASVVVESDVGEPVSDGWRVAADPQRDAPELLFRLGSPAIQRVRLTGVTVEVTERSAEWAYAMTRDGPNLARLRGAFSSVGVSRITFMPAEEVVRAAGLRP